MGDFLCDLLEGMVMTSGLDATNFQFSQPEVSIVQGMWNYFVIVGIGMTLIYFIMELNRKFALEGGDLNFKSMFAPFLKLLIAIVVLSQGAKIVGGILSLNNVMLTEVKSEIDKGLTKGSGGVSLESSLEPMKAAINDWGFFPAVGALIPFLACWLVSMVLKVVWWYKALLYKVEVLFRLGITPIACADIYSGANSTAIRYLKGFMVLGIYGVAMCCLPEIANALALAQLAEAFKEGLSFSGLWDIIEGIIRLGLLAPFAALSCASVARTAAKEALGA